MHFIKTDLTVSGNLTFLGNIIGEIPNPKISENPNNTLIQELDGLFVPDMNPKISSTSGNTLSIDANGLYVPTPTPYTAGNGISISSNVVTAKVSNVAGNSITVDSNGLYSPQISNDYLWVRDKTEVYYTSAFTVTSTPTSLISLLKVLTPSSGTLNKFFNTTSNKLNVYNENSTVFFKLSLTGEWQTGTANLGMQLNFVSTNGNNLNTTRNPAATTDIITFTVFFSVDKDGNLVSNGTDMLIKTFTSSFNVSSALIIAEQMIHPGSVLSVK